jgi:hypothetical protein
MALLGLNHLSATFKSPAGASGRFHAFGFYSAPATKVTLTQANLTQTYGTSNVAYGCRAFLVAGGAGVVGGGTNGTATITISGTSIDSITGVRTASDSEQIVPDITALTTNTYIQSTKRWIGTITYTITRTGNRTTCSVDFNYGFCSYRKFWDHKVTIRQFEATGRAGASDTGFNVQLLKHSNIGWVYSAAAFVPGGTVLLDMNVDYVTEKNLANGERFEYNRKELTTVIDGSKDYALIAPKEGVVVRITTGANNSVESMDLRIHYSA